MSFLRSWFGPSREEIWQQLSQEIGGTLVAGGFWQGTKVVARHGQWTITLDTYTVQVGRTPVTYTRIRAPYVNKDGFRFTISRKDAFTGLSKWLGMQDVEVGHLQFDADYVIQGNDEQKLTSLFASPRIRELIAAQPNIHLTVKDDEGWFAAAFPAGVDELCFHVAGVIQDVPRLKALYELFAEILDHLCRIGSAYEDAPQVKL